MNNNSLRRRAMLRTDSEALVNASSTHNPQKHRGSPPPSILQGKLPDSVLQSRWLIAPTKRVRSDVKFCGVYAPLVEMTAATSEGPNWSTAAIAIF
jgi:hypothetical protein